MNINKISLLIYVHLWFKVKESYGFFQRCYFNQLYFTLHQSLVSQIVSRHLPTDTPTPHVSSQVQLFGKNFHQQQPIRVNEKVVTWKHM